MKKVNLNIFILGTLILLPTFAQGSCSSELRMAIAKKIALRDSLSLQLLDSKTFKKWNKERGTELKTKLASIRPEVVDENFPLKEPINNFLKSMTSHPQHEATKTFIKKYFEKGFIEKWADDLMQNVVTETYQSGKADLIAKLETEGKVDDSIMMKVLESRILSYDFKTDDNKKFHVVTKGLSSTEFGEILKAKKPFIDRAFPEGSSHGPWIHLWHIDMMIQAMRSGNLDPYKASEFYEWMGKNESITMSDGQAMTSQNIWDPLFDSFSGNFTQPETLNPTLMKFFTWR